MTTYTQPAEQRTGFVPFVTGALIILNVGVFVLQRNNPDLTGRYDLIPADTASEPWRLITSTFLHDTTDLQHIIANMLALFLVGSSVERGIGEWLFLPVYLLSALGGSLAVQVFADPHVATLGASGAIYGLFGVALISQVVTRRPEWMLWIVVGVNLVASWSVPHISWQSHVGGLVTGLVLGGVLVPVLRELGKRSARRQLPVIGR